MLLLLLAILLVLIALLVIKFKRLYYRPREEASATYIERVLRRDPYVHKRYIDVIDFLETAYDRVCAELVLGSPYMEGSILKVTTLESTRSDYARDLFCVSRANGTMHKCKTIWDDILAGIGDKPTNEDILWSVIFDWEAKIPPNLAKLSTSNEPGYIATPYYIIKRDYKTIELPADIIPHKPNWYYPANSIDDVYAASELGFKFDSVMDRSSTSLRWYHLALSNMTLPAVKVDAFAPSSFVSTSKRVISTIGGKFISYPGAWMSFIRGDRMDGKGTIIFNEGGRIEPINLKTLFVRGKLNFRISTPINQNLRYIDYDNTEMPQTLMPGQTLSIIIKMNLLELYRYVRCFNAGSSSINIIPDSRGVEVSMSDDSRLVVDSWLTRTNTVSLESRNIHWEPGSVEPDISPNGISLTKCGYSNTQELSTNI